MKAFLMYPGRDFDPRTKPPVNGDALLQDLELGTILKSFGETVGDEGARLAQAVLGSQAPPVKGIAPTLLEAVHNAAIKAMRPTLKAAFRALLEGKSPDDALREGLHSYSTAVKADVKAARDKALKLEASAYKNSKDLYGKTPPSKAPAGKS